MPVRKQARKQRSSAKLGSNVSSRKRPPTQDTKGFAAYVASEMNRLRLTPPEVVQRAEKKGINIDRTTVWRACNNETTEIRSSTVEAFAEALGEPVIKLQAILNGQAKMGRQRETIKITLSGDLYERLSEEARLNRRDISAQLEALLAYYYNGERVNINTAQLDQARRIESNEQDREEHLSSAELLRLEEQVKALGHKYYGMFADDPGALEVFDEIERLRDQHTIGGG